MELNGGRGELAAQERYARWLAWGTRVALAVLAIGFFLYATGILAPHVAMESMASLWHRPAPAFLEHAGLAAGWDWATRPTRSDMLVLAGIALLASCSIAGLAAALASFRAARERVLVAICALQIAVLLLAASGLLTAH